MSPCTYRRTPRSTEKVQYASGNFYWQHMRSDFQRTVAQCMSCTKPGSNYPHIKRLQLFRVSGPFDFVVMDILGPLSKTPQGSQFIFVVTNCYSKLKRAISTAIALSTHMEDISLDNWIVPFGILKFALADNGPQFVSKFSP